MRRIALALCYALIALAPLAACKGPSPTSEKNLAEATAYLEKNAKAEGVKTTESGLQYKVLTAGPANGAHPKMGDQVLVHYEGKYINGTVFDSSFERGTPTSFAVGEVVPGWNEALQLMRPGDEWMFFLPPPLAYGDHPEQFGKPDVPPNSAMIFRVQLIDFLPAH